MNEELIRDIYERMGRMEAKLDDVRQIRVTADNAQRLAERAIQRTETTERDIERLVELDSDRQSQAQTHKRWLVGLAVSSALSALGIALTIYKIIGG